MRIGSCDGCGRQFEWEDDFGLPDGWKEISSGDYSPSLIKCLECRLSALEAKG